MLNATQWRPDRKPVREWDVIRVDLLDDGTWMVNVVECAVNRTKKKDEEAQKRLEVFQQALRGSYADFTVYETHFATIEGNDLSYEDAGRNFKANS
jgi:predicted Ser/Thr protein kinase